MICEKCEHPMRVTNTFRAREGVRTRRLFCSKCKSVRVEIVLLLAPSSRGARKVASDIARNGIEEALRRK